MKTIFISTDFNPSALDCISNLCNQFKNEQLNFIFVHVFKLSDSIGDLLMLSRRSKEYEYITDDFYHKCNEIRKNHSQVNSIRTEFFFGSTMATFRNFIEAHEITHVLEPKDCSYNRLNKSSLDPFAFTSKSGLPMVSLVEIKKTAVEEVLAAPTEVHMMAEAY